MSIWKNSNETAYAGGKKHWADVIKNSGDGNLLIWRQTEEDFNTNSTLIVMPGEEAIFIKGGTIEQTFDNGTYKLSTNNYPFISRLRNVFTGGVSTFNCVVYFVRKAHRKENISWTSSWRDSVNGFALRFPANFDMISGMDKKEAEIWLSKQLQQFQCNGNSTPPIKENLGELKPLNTTNFLLHGNSLFTQKMNNNRYLQVIYHPDYPEESIANLFNYPDIQRTEGIDVQIKQMLYGYESLNPTCRFFP